MRTKALFAVIALAGLLTGCGYTRIARINADPSHWSNRTVRIQGNVVTSVGVLGNGGYQVDDGTGKIFVISQRGVPNKGARVAVSGRVMSGVSILGRSYGTAIREENHKTSF